MGLVFSTLELKDDTVIIVLGASGDLAKKKTVCLYSLGLGPAN
jgi:glucose-6-phosphate 1-dehydrogenase